jgi:Concanavalin A-like lectin/glucanases superfamily
VGRAARIRLGSGALVTALATAIVTGAAPGIGAHAGGLGASTAAVAAPAGPRPLRATADAKVAQAEAASSGENVEITSLRDESSEVYATPDGDFEAVQHLRPVRTRAGGQWQDIDNTLAKGADGSVAPKAAAVGMTFSGGGDGPLVQLERAGRKLAFTWPKPLPEPTLDGDTATYASVLPDVDLTLRADTDGFSELLVVRTAEAARNPDLAELKLSVQAPGLTLQESAGGGIEARDEADGALVFTAPQPVMWDSTGTGEAGTAAAGAAAGAAEPDGQAGEGPGDASNVAPIGVDVAPDGSELRLTPDQGMLTDATTHFPVYIDPQTYTPKAGEWTMVSQYWANSPQWRFNGDSDAGVGYCGWDYCAPQDLKQLFYQFPTSRFAGKTILDATFVGHETFSPSCDAASVQLWRTKGFTSSTTWNSSQDNWLDLLDTVSAAHGYSTSGCPAGNVEFDATDGVKYAASHDSSSTSFGLRAADEDDKYSWKRFSDDAYLRVKYNRPPGQIPMSHLSMDPGGACKKPDSKAYVNTLPEITADDVTDPDGDKVSAQFQAWWDAGDGKGFAAHWTSAKTTPKSSGSDFAINVTSSIPKNKTVAWYARAVDYDAGTYYSYSPWSGAGSATGCYFVYDTGVPSGPSITSGDYPKSDPSQPDDPWYDGVGRYGTFTLDAPDTDVTTYWYGVNEDPSSDNAVPTTGGAAKTVSFRPTRPGLNFVTAQAFDQAGNPSAIRRYAFRVKAGQPTRAQWKLDDPTGAAQAEGTAGERDLQLIGGPTLGAAGTIGTAASFDGVDDYLQSDIPTVDTSTGFSVSAWVRLSTMPDTAAVIAAQPGNFSPGFELYYSKTYDRWAFNQYSADTASATPVRVMQAAAGGVQAGQWVHLAGTYNSASDELSLYVNGTLAGSMPYTTPWDARRGLQIGAGSYDGAAGSFFPGTIDDVRIFDKPLSQGEVTNLYDKQPIGSGRPARAVFPLDEPPTKADGTPTTAVTGRADVNPAVFHGGATPGQPGVEDKALTLDGVDDYASTTPHLNNQRSFSVVAWAKLPTTKPTHAAVIATQAGTVNPGFELYYSATYGWSFNQYSSDDANGTPVRATQGDPAKAPGGVWTQVAGSYDAVTNDLRLYVQGAWVDTTTFASPFYAGGPLQIGAGSYSGSPGSFFPGQIDDVQLFDRALSAPEIADLYKARPIVEGRWKLDSASGSPAVSPDDVATGQHPLTLGGNAAVDASGSNNYVGSGSLVLDGSGDYAATSASPVHTDTSFTASAWVTTSGRPQQPVTVMSQAGASNSGFVVRYVPDPPPAGESESVSGRWQLSMADSDSTSAATTIAENTDFQENSWNNVTVVYDAFADQMRLYVNGELRETLCSDDDDDGVPNVPACTEAVSWNSDVTPFDATKGLQLGRVKTGATTWGEYWPGAIDDVWIFLGVAADEQISTLAAGNDLPTSPGP